MGIRFEPIYINTVGSTDTIPVLRYTQNMPLQEAGVVYVGNIGSTGTTAASAADTPFGSSLSLQRIYIPGRMSLSEVDLAFNVAFPATNQGQGSLSQTFILYEFGNSTSLQSIASASRAVSWATGTTNAGTLSSLQQGWSGQCIQPFTFASSAITPGEYAVAHLMSWAAESTSWLISLYGGHAKVSQTGSVVTNLAIGSDSVAAPFATASAALTAFSAAPTAAGFLSSAGLLAGSVHTATTSNAVTGFTNTAATAPVFLTATGTSVALLAGSVFTGSTSANITAFSGAPTSAPVFATANGTNPALIAASARTGSTTTALTAFTIAPTAASVMSSTGLAAVSAYSASTSTGFTVHTAAQSALNLSGVGSTAALTTTNVSTFTAGARAIQATATAASVVSLLMNTGLGGVSVLGSGGLLAGSFYTASGSNNVLSNAGTAGISLLSSGGFLAGSFLTASSIAGVLSNVGTGGSAFLSSAGLNAGSVMTASGSVGAFTGATGGFSLLASGGLLAGSFLTNSGSAAGLVNAGTAGASVAQSFTTASLAALTGVSTLTAAMTQATTGLPNFRYNGTKDVTEIFQAGPFLAGIMSTGSSPASIDLKSTAVLLTGSGALIQPWFALVGA